MPHITIRAMQRSELEWALDLAANEGWNPGLHDAAPFFAQDPEGFLLALLDGQPVGCISAVKYGRDFGFIGFYIVTPEQRGKGYGLQLWQAAMQRLQGRIIGLDGVIEQQHNYRKSGFALQYSNIRFEYRNTLESFPRDFEDIAPAELGELEAIAAYERAMFPAERKVFLLHWLQMPGAQAYVCKAGSALRGFAVIRPCREGYKIGPLFADTAELAEKLFRKMCGSVEKDELIYLDVPEVNNQAMELARRYAMHKVFGTARMYAGAAPRLDLNKIFGVTSFELG